MFDRRRPRTRSALIVVAIGIATLGAGCRDDSASSPSTVTSPVTLPTELVPSSTSSTSATTPPTDGVTGTPSSAGPPAIEAFNVSAPLTCEGPTFDARVDWRAPGATTASILVDSAQVAGPVPVEGPFDLVLGCDGAAHTVVLVVAAADGSTAVRTRAVLASPGR